MIDKLYKIHRSTEVDFISSMKDILRSIDSEGLYPLRILFFAEIGSNEQYVAMKAQMRELCEAHFGEKMPLLALVAQAPLRCTLASEVTYIDNCYADEIAYHGDYVTFGDEIFSSGISSDVGAEIDIQADDIFQRVEQILSAHDYCIDDITRQWNYIEQITLMAERGQHYQLFNDSRSRFYAKAQWSNGYPAATGLGTYAGGVIVVFDAVRDSAKCSLAVDNPLQISAHAYSQEVLINRGEVHKSTPKFERARYISTPNPSVYVSGTAAIRGEESCREDAVGQAALTMENIDRLVGLENLASSGVSQPSSMLYGAMRAYLKHGEDTERVSEWIGENYPQVDMLYLLADICREELLIEIEGVAIAR